MENLIVGIAAAILALIAVGFVASRFVLSSNAKRAASALPTAGPDDVEESVVGLTAPFKAYGLLRLTPSELLFASGSAGDVLIVPRTAIAACVASEDIPTGSGMQTLRRKALVIQIDDPSLPQGIGFMVADPAEWVRRLRGQV